MDISAVTKGIPGSLRLLLLFLVFQLTFQAALGGSVRAETSPVAPEPGLQKQEQMVSGEAEQGEPGAASELTQQSDDGSQPTASRRKRHSRRQRAAAPVVELLPEEPQLEETQQEEAKQVETKQAESKQAESKQAESKQAESKQAESKQAESKQAESKQAESKQAESKQAESKQAESKQAESKQAESKQAESKQAESKQAESKPAAGAAEVPAPAIELAQGAAAVSPAAQVTPPVSGGYGPRAAQEQSVSWWRLFAYQLGLASDPRPGETALAVAGGSPGGAEYVIGAGDVLGISVWRDENLTRSLVVLPDGKITFPLVGEIVAGGKTVAQLKQELEGKLSRYVMDSGLTVEVKQSNSMIIYIIGRVNVPGRQMLVAPTNVLQGLAMAGGLNPFAKKQEIKVFRQGEKTEVFSFNYVEVSEGRHLESNIELKRGDVILVP